MEKVLTQQSLNARQQEALNKALHIAIHERDLDMMTNAVDSGADANVLLFGGIENGALDWVKAAVDRGADVNGARHGLEYGDVLSSSKSYPVFFWLARYPHDAIGDYLISKGAKIDLADRDGDTALLAAVNMRAEKAIMYLVTRGANPLQLCADNQFPLQQLEDDNRLEYARKTPLIKAMMENMKKHKGVSPPTAPAASADDVPATSEAIEISRPLELKRKPASGFAL